MSDAAGRVNIDPGRVTATSNVGAMHDAKCRIRFVPQSVLNLQPSTYGLEYAVAMLIPPRSLLHRHLHRHHLLHRRVQQSTRHATRQVSRYPTMTWTWEVTTAMGMAECWTRLPSHYLRMSRLKRRGRMFMRQYQKYLGQINALQSTGSRPFAMPVSACMDHFSKRRIALFYFSKDYNAITEHEWVA